MTDYKQNQDPNSSSDDVEVEDQHSMPSYPDENPPRPKNKSLWMVIIVPMFVLVIGMIVAAKFMPQAEVKTKKAVASMNERYPGYTGDISPSGTVITTFLPQGNIQFAYDLQGLEPNCVDCGIHIHEGTTCDDAEEVGGHYYSVGEDPWTSMGGAVYNSDANGEAAGSFTLKSGYDTCKENLGHAVVAHSQNGTRLSCGILTAES
ncbi:hypothetical protein ACHAXA_008641 [Cyclostephanos tholiformis]|uniref:Superoxide dismutase copper/zinc binding domain-containing protein n=1 Tax=Cyclostephanos tholiformis TaxID=382380 RepID=A0ABD3RBD3_9STRA